MQSEVTIDKYVLKSHFTFIFFPTVREGEKRSTHMPAVLTTHRNFVPGCLDSSYSQHRCTALKVTQD